MDNQENSFTVRDIARIFNLHESRIRYWAQTGFINPSGAQGGKRYYTFIDLVTIKAAKELLDRGIPLQRVRKNLQALKDAVPQIEHPLNQLRVCSDGEHLLVVDPEGTFDPLSGQMILDFKIEDLHSHVAEILDLHSRQAKDAPPNSQRNSPTQASTSPGNIVSSEELITSNEADKSSLPQTAYGWFLLGCAYDRQEKMVQEAVEAYQKALELDPTLAAAYTNLGNIHYTRGDFALALHYYEKAASADPEQPEARYNLANLYEEQDNLDMAIAEYRRAIYANPDFIDAHFNLALALEKVGSRIQAKRHWLRYLELSSQNEFEAEDEWLRIARNHLAILEESAI